MRTSKFFQITYFLIILIVITGCQKYGKNIERPEKIVSKREVVYNQQTYSRLAKLWKEYYSEFPSEDAYANWMYAARYAHWDNYKMLLEDGLRKYYSNPTLMFLSAIEKQSKSDNLESTHLLEKAAQLDPSNLDPWFSLTINYMESENTEKFEVALNHILKKGAIADEIMDYNFNVLTLLEKDAILITNGDNDTYPGWIITRILKYRPDVRIVNRSLLNTEWYPQFLKDDGIPNFTTHDKLTKLRKDILNQIKDGQMKMPTAGPFSDTLISNIIKTARVEHRPVYLASTLYSSDIINRYIKNGQKLGLVTLVSPTDKTYASQIEIMTNSWLKKFRIGGLNSWHLRYGKESLAGKRLITNYAAAIYKVMDEIIKYTPERRLELFRWYKLNLLDLISPENIDKFNKMWCKSKDIKEIFNWCKSKNYLE